MIHRQWFQRIWIVQELARAKHTQMSCGGHNALWEDAYRVLMILTPIRDAFANSSQIWKRIPEGKTAFVCAGLRSRLQPCDDYALESMKQIICVESSKQAPNGSIASSNISFQSLRTERQVYALLGLATDWNEAHPIQLDCNRKTTQLYIEVAKVLPNSVEKIDDASEEIVQVSRDRSKALPLPATGNISFVKVSRRGYLN